MKWYVRLGENAIRKFESALSDEPWNNQSAKKQYCRIHYDMQAAYELLVFHGTWLPGNDDDWSKYTFYNHLLDDAREHGLLTPKEVAGIRYFLALNFL